MRWALIIAFVVLALAGAAYIAVNQIAARYTYRTDPTHVAPDLPGVEEVRLHTEDGETLIAWRHAAAPGQPTILFFHGNASTLIGGDDRYRAIMAHEAGFLAVSYRGYSGSTGRPSEEGFRKDARAAYDFLIAQGLRPGDIVIHGHSLGTAVAARLASERPARALVLEAPMTAIIDIAQARAPGAPLDLFMRDQFRTRDIIASINMPLLIVHGDQDNVIPIAMGERLFARAREPKRFIRVEGGGHSDLPAHGLYDDIFAFLGS